MFTDSISTKGCSDSLKGSWVHSSHWWHKQDHGQTSIMILSQASQFQTVFFFFFWHTNGDGTIDQDGLFCTIFQEMMTVKQLTDLMLRQVWKIKSIPKSNFFSNQGIIFVSQITKELNKQLDIQSHPPTVNHPRTDRPSGIAKKLVEQYVCQFYSVSLGKAGETLA